MIVNSRVNRIEATREKDGPGKGLKIQIDIKDVGGKGEDVDVGYEFTAEYVEGVGKIFLAGEITDRTDKKIADEARKMWKEKKEISSEYRLSLLNSINYVASIEGVLASKIVRLPPPLAPPRLTKKE
ncbi:MAG: hypothetical protein NTY83_03290 [Candidatus Micrarchaeota archaeon]|nr:hypothetical protein [Candidatus Micrarchaeota archaeon]